MKKTLLITTLLASTLLLASCGNTENAPLVNDTKPLTGGGSTVETSATSVEDVTVETETAIDENAEAPVVYVVGANEDLIKNATNGLVFLDDTDEVSVKLAEAMKAESGADLTIDPTEEAKAQGVEPLKIRVWEYYPVFIFDTTTPDFDYDRINKENPNLIYTLDTEKGKFFAFKDPSFLGAGKEVVTFNDEVTELVMANSIDTTTGKENDKQVILVEDPLCPYCAKKFLGTEEAEVLNEYNTKILWLPLPIQGHENSEKLIQFMYLNAKDGVIDRNLISAVFEKQSELGALEITDGSNVIKVLETSTYKDSLGELVVGDLATTSYSVIETQKAASALGVT